MKSNLNKINKIAKDVYRSLGSGFSEDVYDKAMQVGLRLAKVKYENQKVVEVKYKNYSVGEGYPDLIIHFPNEIIAVELKAVSGDMGDAEERQLKNYMKILKIRAGLLINFPQPGRKENKTKLYLKEI